MRESRLLSGGQGRPQRRPHARFDGSVGGFGRFAWGGMLGVGPVAGNGRSRPYQAYRPGDL